jgi:hypothetical protein
VPLRSVSSRFGPAMSRYIVTGKIREKMKKRRLRKVRSTS